MTEIQAKPKTTPERVEAALKDKARVARMRTAASQHSDRDPLGAKFMTADADKLEEQADKELCRWSYTTASAERTESGELVPITSPTSSPLQQVISDGADMLEHAASERRLELSGKTESLSLALDLAREVGAENAAQKALAHHAAAAFSLGMEFMHKSRVQVGQVESWNPKSYQAHSVEACRLANASARLMGAFNEALLTLNKLKSGGQQSVVVTHIHQHVQVNEGGQAVVAGNLKKGGGTGVVKGGGKGK